MIDKQRQPHLEHYRDNRSNNNLSNIGECRRKLGAIRHYDIPQHVHCFHLAHQQGESFHRAFHSRL